MLIVISDLHFSDGSSSHNISHRAFSHFFEHIKRGLRDEFKELIIVFAGDTLDLLRSEYWMTVEDGGKPWAEEDQGSGVSGQGSQNHLKTILEKILNENESSLAIIRQVEDMFHPVPVKIYIIPGNHDRMLVEIDDYKGILDKYLGNISILDASYENRSYGVRIRHGHEYDTYNFEEGGGVPIGDVNTTELFVYLPFEIKKQYPELADELRCVEDIRPQWRVFDYLGSTYPEGEINRCIREATEQTIDHFFKIPFVESWIEKHDTASLLDDTDKLEYMLRFFQFLPLSWAEKLLKTFSHFEMGEQHYEEMAEKEEALYVVYGHTHTENVSFLGITEGQHRYYVNTGTWRERITASNKGVFSRYKTLTYAVFYTKEERHTEFPSFELWNGMLRE
ncbi:MAG: metallophosphoesterase [Proteobacteria bacterium]|nr:metallophosphoesterase [Pseudomonadota bacterium]